MLHSCTNTYMLQGEGYREKGMLQGEGYSEKGMQHSLAKWALTVSPYLVNQQHTTNTAEVGRSFGCVWTQKLTPQGPVCTENGNSLPVLHHCQEKAAQENQTCGIRTR